MPTALALNKNRGSPQPSACRKRRLCLRLVLQTKTGILYARSADRSLRPCDDRDIQLPDSERQANARASEAGNGLKIEYRIPKEGTQVWFDLMAIPADAPNPEQAHAFINYILKPEVAASISNEVGYANPNAAATLLVNEALRNNPGAYPPQEVQARIYTLEPLPMAAARVHTRSWTRIKTGS